MCPEHEMEKVNMYCEVCKRPVCHLCKLGGSHANHKVTSMSNAYKILKVTLDATNGEEGSDLRDVSIATIHLTRRTRTSHIGKPICLNLIREIKMHRNDQVIRGRY